MATLEEVQVAAKGLLGVSVTKALHHDKRHLERIASGLSDLYSPEQVQWAKVILEAKRTRGFKPG